MRRMALAVLSSVVLSACQPATIELTDQQKAEIAAAVDSLTNEWWAAWEDFDLERGLSFIDDGPDMTWAADHYQTVYSIAEAREVWGPSTVGFERQDFEITNARTVVLGPDVVWTLRELNFTLVDTTGAVAAQGLFEETAVWVKRNGEWKILLGHDDDATPCPQP